VIYLLDTDTLIYMVRGLKLTEPRNQSQRERAELAGRLLGQCRKHSAHGDTLGISAVTVAELEHGARLGGRYDEEIAAVQKILSPFEAFDFDARSSAVHYGRIFHALEERGKTIGVFDVMIAAQALALDATLVTNNLAHFRRVDDLKCVNWAG
jgi:tRNA(fMet)-specific endonuclease VapC